MNEWYVNNRQLVRNLAIDTGTSTTPVWSPLCTTSEVEIVTDFEMKDFYVFCDAIKRSVITGTAMSLECTVKLDINSIAIQSNLGDIHTLIKTGEIVQFQNKKIQFELLEKATAGVLTYAKYTVPVNMIISDLGGAAEDEGDYSVTFNFNGKGTLVSA